MDYHRILNRIKNDPRYAAGIQYGTPRKGHGEGSVKNHIAELEATLYRLADLLQPNDFVRLQILIHTHDTFKLWALRDVPIDNLNSHATLAAGYLRDMGCDADLVAMCQWHDENFALWKRFVAKGAYNTTRFVNRVLGIQDIELYLVFTIIDGFTFSKQELAKRDITPMVRWFVEEVAKHRTCPRAHEALAILGL